MLAENSCDVELKVVQMPEMDGLEATRRIRHGEVTTGRRIPIIAMTAQAMKGDRERCLAAGMDVYLSKPIRSRQVLEAIEMVTAPQWRGPGNGSTEFHDASVPLATTTFPDHSLPVDSGLPSRSSTAAGFNRAAALAAVDGDETLLCDVAEAFLAESPRLIIKAETALRDNDTKSLAAAAHTLKGAAASFGEHPAVDLAYAVEQAAKADDLDGARRLWSRLEEALSPLIAGLSGLVTGKNLTPAANPTVPEDS